jgi:hypothetical protein
MGLTNGVDIQRKVLLISFMNYHVFLLFMRPFKLYSCFFGVCKVVKSICTKQMIYADVWSGRVQ